MSCSSALNSILWKGNAVAGSQIPVSPNGYGCRIHFNSHAPPTLSCILRISHAPPRKTSSSNNYSLSYVAGNSSTRTSCGRVGNMDNTTMTRDDDESSLTRRISSPWLMLPPEFGGNNMIYKFYSLADDKVVSFTKSENGDSRDTIDKYFKRLANKSHKTDDDDDDMPDHDADFVGSSHGWLIFFNRSDKNMFLSDPISRHHVKLPPMDTLAIPESNFKGGYGCVTNVMISCSPEEEEGEGEQDGEQEVCYGECRAMMIFGPQDRLAFCCPGHSLEWTPLGKVRRYDDYHKFWARSYESVVYSTRQKLFFSVTRIHNEFEAWDLRDPESPRRIAMDDVEVEDGKSLFASYTVRGARDPEILHRQFLVVAEHCDDLFLVRQFYMERMGPDGLPVEFIYYGPMTGFSKDNVPYKTVGFDVHKYDPVDKIFKYINTGGDGVHTYDPELKAFKYTSGSSGSGLDGLVFFIGANQGFALRAGEYPELKPNSIYFTDTGYEAPKNISPECDGHNYGGHDVGIYSYDDGTFSPCYLPCDYGSFQKIQPAPMWFTPR